MGYTGNTKSTGLDTLDNTTLANGDLAIVGDVSDSGRAKAITWTNLKAFLKTYFDTIYQAVLGLTSNVSGTGFTITGGTTPKTLTVPLDATVSGTNTGDQTTVSGNAGSATVLQTARNINGVSFNGSANISVPDLPVTVLSANATQTMTTNSAYLASTSFFGTTTLTLPATSAAGDRLRIAYRDTVGTLKIEQGSGQSIRANTGGGSTTTTVGTGGYIQGGNQDLFLELICTSANTEWTVSSIIGGMNTDGSVYFSNIGFAINNIVGVLVGTQSNQTVINKNIVPRVLSSTTTSTLTPGTGDSTYDNYFLTAQAGALTVAAPTGTPENGARISFRFKDNGTARAITWNSIYRVVGTTLPTTTVINKLVYVEVVYNATDTKWDVINVRQEV